MSVDKRRTQTSKRQETVAFRRGRNATQDRAIRREMPNATAAELRFQALRLKPGDPNPGSLHWQEIRAAVIDALDDQIHGRAALPHDIALFVRNALYAVSQGDTPELVASRLLAGGRGNSRKLANQDQIDAATNYLIAVDTGHFVDKRSRATVAELYGVSREQVHKWLRAVKPMGLRDCRFFEPWNAYATRGGWLQVGKMLRKLMEIQAAAYRSARRPRLK